MRYKQTTQSKIYIDISLKSEHTQNREESKKKWWHERKTQHIKKLKQIKSKICQFEIRTRAHQHTKNIEHIWNLWSILYLSKDKWIRQQC